MRSLIVIGFLIKNDYETNILQKFQSNFNTIISINLNVSKLAVFQKIELRKKTIAKLIVYEAFWNEETLNWNT